jgi:DNA-binding transcriptional ArsR family regulator
MLKIEACLKEFGEEIKADIIEALKKEQPLTITAIASRTSLSWKTAKRRLIELKEDGRIVLREIEGGTKLFFLNPEFEKEERAS